MTSDSLQHLLDGSADTMSFLRGTKYHRRNNIYLNPPLIIPQIPYEFSAWEREQRAWREGVALFDQSHHMQAAVIRGPEAKQFLSHLACNNLANATPNKAFQIICVSPDGNMIGDGILLPTNETDYSAVGPFIMKWIEFQSGVLDFDVEVKCDLRSRVYANGHASERPECRYQIQGPNAWALIEKLNGAPVTDVPFFNVTQIKIAGLKIGALRHGMAGTPGLEIWGPWDKRDLIRDTILREGEAFGIAEVGAASYCCAGIESGWLQGVLPDIYTSDSTRAYRQWLSADDLEGLIRVVGSQQVASVQDFYRTPNDLGYGRFVHMEHEFIGRDALRRAASGTLQKASLVWDAKDTAQLFEQMMSPAGGNVKMLHLPIMCEKTDFQYFTVTKNGAPVGTAHYTAYLSNERAMVTLSLVDASLKMGEEVVLHWGEIGGGEEKYATPATDITPIKAMVSPAPFSRVARESYKT